MPTKDKYNQLKLEGKCTNCSRTPVVEGKFLCQICLNKSKANADKRRNDRRKKGLCFMCGNKIKEGHLCEGCRNKSNSYYHANAEMYKEIHRKYYSTNKNEIARRKIKKAFNITDAQLDELWSITNCEICGCELDNSVRSKKTADKYPHIDHCHNTGRIRGVLCKMCNTMLGMAKDNPEILTKAIVYLNK